MRRHSENNRELRQFLERIGLQRYAEDLIYAGFDDVDTLLEVDSEVLNSLRVRAAHQKTLEKELRRLKHAREGREGEKGKAKGTAFSTQEIDRSLVSSRSSISNRHEQRPRTEISVQCDSPLDKTDIKGGRSTHNSHYNAHIHNHNHNKRKKETSPSPSPSLQSSGSLSFLYSAGGKSFSAVAKESVPERKACCCCFKVTYTPCRYGNYYDCSEQCIAKDKARSKRAANRSREKSPSLSLLASPLVQPSSASNNTNNPSTRNMSREKSPHQPQH